MSFPNTSYDDLVSTTLDKRSKKIADNVSKNNALLSRLNQKGNIRTFDGGVNIIEELSFAENGNFGWFSGYDLLPVAAQDVISSAVYNIKQCATAVTISGLEMLQNSGEPAQINLLESRIKVAEKTMANKMAEGLYSDGTGYGGKQIGGLLAAVPLDPTTGTYAGIDRATWTFWRSQLTSLGSAPTAANIQAHLNAAWAKQVRGVDRPDLILMDNAYWAAFTASLQTIQRFTSEKSASLGFPSVDFMGADVVLDGGLGGFCPTNVAFMLNTDYIFLRPHAKRNMVSLSPDKRSPVNQDAQISILGWAGNLTISNSSLQGYLKGS